MNSTPYYLYSNSFAKRIVIRRVFLKECFSKETVMLYAKLLSLFPNHDKKKRLPGTEYHFDCFAYNDGILFQGSVSQTKSDAFSFLFMNPYKQAEEALNSLFQKGFVYSEKNLAVGKEILELENEERFFSSKNVSSYLHQAKCIPLLDKNRLQSIKKTDLDEVKKMILQSKIGEEIYFGPQEKETLYFPISYEEKLPLYQKQDRDVSSFVKNMDDESLVLSFSLKEVPKTEKSLLSVLLLTQKAITENLKGKIFVEYSLSSYLSDKCHFSILLSVKQGKASSLLPFFEKDTLPFEVKMDEKFLKKENEGQNVLRYMDAFSFLEDSLLRRNLGFSSEEEKEDMNEVSSLLSSLLKEKNCILRKEEEHD